MNVLSIRLPEEVDSALRAAAVADRRPPTTLARLILTDWLTEHGYLNKDDVK